LILFVASILFFVGIGYWIWQVDKAISGIVMDGITAASLITNTNLLHIAASSRTSVSIGLFKGIIRQGIESLKVLVIKFSRLL
jgi:hypothetical protein